MKDGFRGLISLKIRAVRRPLKVCQNVKERGEVGVALSFPATRLRHGFAGVEVQERRSFSVGGKQGIQDAAPSL